MNPTNPLRSPTGDELTQVRDLRGSLRRAGAKPAHIERILRNWLQAKSLLEIGPAYLPPQAAMAALPTLADRLAALAEVRSEHISDDGSARLLIGLADGQTIESVLLPRDGVCVSTQVGCAVGCTFCMTGRSGLLRQLGSAEIVAQVVLARRRRPIRKVVFMGMGEPAHNLDNVIEAMDVLGTAGGIGHKNLVFSTVGDRRVFARLPAERVKPALALSLHSTRAELRAQLLPNAPRIEPAELIELAGRYSRTTGYPVQYQWTLIEGVNDGDDEFDALADMLKGQYAVMNLIPYNRVEGAGFRRPDAERAARLSLRLYRAGILAKLRNSAGGDVAAACGQLRARSPAPPRATVSR